MTEGFKNSLEVQREYFELVLQINTDDETIHFAVAQILKELGEETAANACYDAGIAQLNRRWFPKLFLFTGATGALAAALWAVGLRWAWLLVAAGAIGPIVWWIIRRNRHNFLPQVGFWQRAETIEKVDLRAEIARIKKEPNKV